MSVFAVQVFLCIIITLKYNDRETVYFCVGLVLFGKREFRISIPAKDEVLEHLLRLPLLF